MKLYPPRAFFFNLYGCGGFFNTLVDRFLFQLSFTLHLLSALEPLDFLTLRFLTDDCFNRRQPRAVVDRFVRIKKYYGGLLFFQAA